VLEVLTYYLHYQPRFGLAGKLVSRAGCSRVSPIAGFGYGTGSFSTEISLLMHARQDVVLLDNPAYSDVQAARDAVPYGPMLDQGHGALSFLPRSVY
jgi:hypothetical protein